MNNNNSLLSEQPYNSDHPSYFTCEKGLVSAVYPLTQSIDVVINGSLVLGVQVCPSLTAGPRGMALPRVNDMVLFSRVEGIYYCIAVLPAKYKPTAKSTVKYAPEDAIKNYKNPVDRSKDENLKEAERSTDPDSFLTHRSLVRPGDSALYRSDPGASIVGSNDGEVAMVGSPTCYSSWHTSDHLHHERMENHVYEHTAGIMKWIYDRNNKLAAYLRERYTREENAGYAMKESFSEENDVIHSNACGKVENGTFNKFWEVQTSSDGVLTLATTSEAKTTMTITIDPSGQLSISTESGIDVQAKGTVNIGSSKTVVLNAKTVKLAGNDTEIKSAYNISIESANKNISIKAPRGMIDMRAKKIQMAPAPKVNAALTAELKKQIDNYVKKSVSLNTKKRR